MWAGISCGGWLEIIGHMARLLSAKWGVKLGVDVHRSSGGTLVHLICFFGRRPLERPANLIWRIFFNFRYISYLLLLTKRDPKRRLILRASSTVNYPFWNKLEYGYMLFTIFRLLRTRDNVLRVWDWQIGSPCRSCAYLGKEGYTGFVWGMKITILQKKNWL